LPDLTADLQCNFQLDLSKEALHKRFNTEAVNFLKEVFKVQLEKQLSARIAPDVAKYFNAINIKDSTKFSLPDTFKGHYPGFGNFSKINGIMNLQYEYEIISGKWKSIEMGSARVNDQRCSNMDADSLITGELYIRDLGYITPTYLKSIVQKEAFFLNRLPVMAGIYSMQNKQLTWDMINAKLAKVQSNTLEMDILLYKKEKIKCRLIIERIPDQDYEKRLQRVKAKAKSNGVGITKEHKLKCRFNAYITNVDAKALPADSIRRTYYLRWQIELIFKTWKSYFELNKIKKVKRERIECQILARLIWIFLNWRIYQICNNYVQNQKKPQTISLLKFFKRCQSLGSSLRLVILNETKLVNWLKKTFLPMIYNTAGEIVKGKKPSYLLLKEICLS